MTETYRDRSASGVKMIYLLFHAHIHMLSIESRASCYGISSFQLMLNHDSHVTYFLPYYKSSATFATEHKIDTVRRNNNITAHPTPRRSTQHPDRESRILHQLNGHQLSTASTQKRRIKSPNRLYVTLALLIRRAQLLTTLCLTGHSHHLL